MADSKKLEEQVNACYSKVLDKSILNTDLVKLLDAYWFDYFSLN